MRCEETVPPIVSIVIGLDPMTPATYEKFLIRALDVRDKAARSGLKMVDDAFCTIVNLMARFARSQAVIDVLPPIQIGRIEPT